MNNIIKLEELAKLLFSFWLATLIGFTWWVFPVWLLAPDLSMIGYLINTKIGAWLYNFFHHQGIAIGVGVIGYLLHEPTVQMAGIILFGHSAMDRALGYGLKFEDDFKHTHLGRIDKS